MPQLGMLYPQAIAPFGTIGIAPGMRAKQGPRIRRFWALTLEAGVLRASHGGELNHTVCTWRKPGGKQPPFGGRDQEEPWQFEDG